MTFDEVDVHYRESGLLNAPNEPTLKIRPTCLALRRELQQQLSVRPGNVPEALKEKHECPSYVEWCRGRTPLEHREMRLEEIASEERRADKRNDRIFQVVLLFLGPLMAGLGGVVGYTLRGDAPAPPPAPPAITVAPPAITVAPPAVTVNVQIPETLKLKIDMK